MGSSGVGLATALPLRDAATAVAGTSHLASDSSHVHPTSRWIPADYGLLAWTGDPVAYTTGSQAASGTTMIARLRLPVTSSVTNVCLFLTTGGNTLTTGQCFAGLYNAAGTLLDSTADQASAWATSGFKAMALTGGATSRAAGDYYVAWFYVGSGTLPAFARGAQQATINLNLSAPNLRFATADASRTTSLADPMGTQSAATATAYWAGLS